LKINVSIRRIADVHDVVELLFGKSYVVEQTAVTKLFALVRRVSVSTAFSDNFSHVFDAASTENKRKTQQPLFFCEVE